MATVNRREFLKASVTAAASAEMVRPDLRAAARPAALLAPLIDAHVYLSRWPFRRMKGDAVPDLVDLLKTQGVTQAWAGNFDALLHKDLAGSNCRLAEECEKHGKGFLLPFGAVNPLLPEWEEDLRRCHEDLHMPGIRLHPNYHDYTLEDPALLRLLRLGTERGLLIQIVAWMEDERCQNLLMPVNRVDLGPLPALLGKVPGAKLAVLNGFPSMESVEELLPRFLPSANIAFDFAMLDGLLAVKRLVDAVGVQRVVFGSYSPMFYFESAMLKVQEAALAEEQTASIFAHNALRLLGEASS